MFFDSHAHYDDKAFDEDRDELLKKLFNTCVCGIINVGCNMTTSQRSVELANLYPLLWASVGVHPHDTENVSHDYIESLKKLIANEKTIAIGEIGLDYHYNFSPRGAQKRIFEDQLILAKELDLPVIIHSRDATADTLYFLKKYKPRGVIHCFSGSTEIANEIINIGMYIGLGGAVTFKNAKNPVLVTKSVPIDRILLETDCPYMAPVPYRGSRCDSSMIKFTAEKIALERNISVDDLWEATKENTLKLFYKIKN